MTDICQYPWSVSQEASGVEDRPTYCRQLTKLLIYETLGSVQYWRGVAYSSKLSIAGEHKTIRLASAWPQSTGFSGLLWRRVENSLVVLGSCQLYIGCTWTLLRRRIGTIFVGSAESQVVLASKKCAFI